MTFLGGALEREIPVEPKESRKRRSNERGTRGIRLAKGWEVVVLGEGNIIAGFVGVSSAHCVLAR